MDASTRLIAIISIYTLNLPCRSTTSEDHPGFSLTTLFESHGDNTFRVIHVNWFCSSTKPNEYRNRTQDILFPVNSYNPPLGFCALFQLIYSPSIYAAFAHIATVRTRGPYCIYVFRNKLKTSYDPFLTQN